MSFSAIILFALAIGVALLLPVAGVWLAIHVVRGLTWALSGLFAGVGWIISLVEGCVADTIHTTPRSAETTHRGTLAYHAPTTQWPA